MKSDTKKNEGFRSTIYKDTKGIETVGQGFNTQDPVTRDMLPKDVAEGKRAITKQENETTYNKRMDLAKQDARTYLGAKDYDALDDNRKSVLHDMSYNIGLTRLMKFEKLKDAIQKKDWERAGAEILNSKYAKDVPERAKTNAGIMSGQEEELEKEIIRQTPTKK